MTATVRERIGTSLWKRFVSVTVVGVVIFSGCGPIQVASAVGDAEEAIAAAQDVDAERYAQYEYWMAILYLEKAKRVDGRAEYMAATSFAAEAVDFATAAVEVSGKEKIRQQVMQQRLEKRRKESR